MHRPILILLAAASILDFLPRPARGQIGDRVDKPGTVQNEVVPPDLIPPSPTRSAEEEKGTFQLAPGFRIDLVAEEPMVEDPISLQFDADGRMYVVEMKGYMNTVDSDNEELANGRVVVLSGVGAGGRAVRAEIFADRLVMPRAVMPVAEGALVGVPPNLWYLRASDSAGRAIQRTKITDNFGFGSGYGAASKLLADAVTRMPNTPLWDIDNHIYFAEYTTRLRYAKGTFQVEPSTFRGEWGITQDDTGHLYYNYSEDGLRGDLIPPQYTLRNPDQSRTEGVNVRLCDDQFVWPVRVNPGVNRGYQPGILIRGRLRRYTAACSPAIYRGDLFPSGFEGNCFVCEPAGNLVRRYVFTHNEGRLIAKNAYARSEFLASTDERFRPVGLISGPDGCLYLVDMYRGVIEDKISITSYLRRQILNRGLQTPVHLGRIWRISPEGAAPRAWPHLSTASAPDLVQHLGDGNGWWRDTAQRLLVERGDVAVVPALKTIVAQGKVSLGRLHALWTLDGLGRLDEATGMTALRDSDACVRSAAVRLSEPWLREPASRARLVGRLAPLARDPSYEVRLQLALSLGEAGDPETDRLLADLITEAGRDRMMTYAITSGLAHRELRLLESLMADPRWRNLTEGQAGLVRELVTCVAYERQPGNVARFVVLAGKGSASWQIALLDGFAAAGPYLKSRPVRLEEAPSELAQLGASSVPSLASLARETLDLLTWPGKPGTRPPPPALSPEEQRRFDLGKVYFDSICAACHQTHGRGMDGLAPPLADSEWVNGSEERLVRIVLKGLHGTVRVKRKNYYMEMPAWGALDDGQLADILTYIRRAWEHTSAPISPDTVRLIRAATAQRSSSWTQDELLKVP